MKKIILALASLLTGMATAEVLFVPLKKDTIDASEYALCHKAYLKHHFPLNTVSADGQLSAGSIKADPAQEIESINKSLQFNKLPIRAIYMPTTLYELLALKKSREFLDQVDDIFAHSLQESHQFLDLEKSPFLIEAHRQINNYILSQLEEVAAKQYILGAPSWLDVLKKYHRNRGFVLPTAQIMERPVFREVENIHELAAIVSHELEAYKNKRLLLWRASHNTALLPEEQTEKRSISFSASVFAGILNDSGSTGGSCFATRTNIYSHALCPERAVYHDENAQTPLVISLPRNATLLDSMLVVQPCSTLQALLQHGEYFHPRTRFYSPLRTQSFHRIESIEGFFSEECDCTQTPCIHNRLYQAYNSPIEDTAAYTQALELLEKNTQVADLSTY